jgi:hypothetical protein
MQFRPEPELPPPPPPAERALWSRLLYGSAAGAALATRWPWQQVKFERLFGEAQGHPAWQSTAGGTCLATSLLLLVLAVAETDNMTSRRAVRPSSLLLATLALGSFLLAVVQGPGSVRGTTAVWTAWFWLEALCLPLLWLACFARWRGVARRSRAG